MRNFMPRGLFGRSLLIVVIPLVLLQAVSAYVFYSRHWQDVGRRLALGFAGDIAFIVDAIEVSDDVVDRSWMIRRARTYLAMEVSFTEGAVLPDAPPHALFGPVDWMLARVLPERIGYPFQFDTRSNPERVVVETELPSGVLRVIAPRKRLFSSTTYIFILWMVGTSLVLVAIAIYFLRRQIGPMRRLAHAAESFGKGVQAVDFKPTGATEVRQAARAFLQMRERIQRQMTQRTEMLAGVSHDLRTPLTRMKLQLEMAPDKDAAAALTADVADMERMVEGYLAFARGEGSEVPIETDLGELLLEIVENAHRHGADIAIDTIPARLILMLRRDAIKRAITNLTDNASRHGGQAVVSVTRGGDMIEIAIDDDGPGIPANNRESVFKPFFRLDESRNPETGGVGLGLTIARDVVRNHGGDLVLLDSLLGGLRASIRLPA